ncbi:MAG: hypothetical protein HOW73_26085 [Polyangiaceae bacterium]|nr:hypothetical protein [Polyangiaceae bacterium]
MAKRTRRVRHEPPKVWHNPDVLGDRRGSKGTKKAATPAPAREDLPPSSRGAPRSGRIVAVQRDAPDDRAMERDRLLGKLRLAEGRSAVTRAADELFKAGFELPADDQHVHLQLLEHSDEARVRSALAQLRVILEEEPVKRFAVLDSRLRRLEEFAEDAEVRAAATELRRRAKPAPEQRRA